MNCWLVRGNWAGRPENGQPDMASHWPGSSSAWPTMICFFGATGWSEPWRTEASYGSWSDGVGSIGVMIIHCSSTPLLHGFSPRTICLKFSQMFFRPATKRVQRFDQSPPQLCERIFHFGRHDWVHLALHQTIALKAAQSLG